MSVTDREYTEKFFKKLEQVYYWMIAVPLVFISLGFLGVEGGVAPRFEFSESTMSLLQYLLPMLLLIDIGFVHFYYKSSMNKLSAELTIREKLQYFRTQSLIVYAAGFFYALILSMIYYFTHIQLVLPLYLGLLLYITFRRPSVSKAANDLKLDAETYKSINYRDIPLDQ